MALLFAAMLTIAACGSSEDNVVSPPETENPETPSNTDNPGETNKPGDTDESEMPEPVQLSKDNDMKLFAHYMPWFVKPSASGVWNHWTMSTNALQTDHSNLASHYSPLISPYASNDEAVLDYQCLMMKYSGLDGVIIDYMGESGKNDYASIAANTKKMVASATKAGLQFAICYDEQTALSSFTFPDLNDAKDQGRSDMRFISNNFLNLPNYVKDNGKPVLLIFGPARVKGKANWEYITEPLNGAKVIVLNNMSGNYGNASGEFLWVNPSPNYSNVGSYDMYIAGAMPGFWDVYKQFGQGEGYTTYDRQDGALFLQQLNAAKEAGLKWLQISTWNDYGEGTVIEPTKEFGYQYLTILQQFAKVSLTEQDLKLVARWYEQRISKPTNKSVAKAYAYLAALERDKAIKLLDELEKQQ